MDAGILERLFDASNAALMAFRAQLGADGSVIGATILAANRVAAEQLRTSAEQLVGADGFLVFGEATRAQQLTEIAEVLRTQKGQVLFRYVQEADRWYRIQIVPLGPDEFALIAVDITLERMMAEHQSHLVQQATERETLYRTLFDSVPVGVVLVGMDGRVTTFNTRGHEQLGYTRDEFARLTIAEIDYEESIDEVRARNARVAETGHDAFFTKHRTKAGELRDVRVLLRQVELGSGPQILSVIEDLTDQKQLAEQFQQAQKLESIGRLAGGVAHDFNNLLTIILGGTEELLEQVEGDEPLSELREIQRAGVRASELTRQLLAFARKQVISPVVLDLDSVLASNQKMLRRLLGEDVRLEVRQTPDLWRVRCDPGLVEQIVMNLAVNARDAMPRGGRLLFETANVELDEPLEEGMKTGPWVRLSIEDEGEGMTEEVRAHLFEPFFTTKSPGRGTGLGLAMVYGIVKQSQGVILVKSAPAAGTRFDLYFPQVDEGDGTPSQPVRRSMRGHETLLLVEDDDGVRGMVQRALVALGYTAVQKWGLASPKRRVEPADFAPIGRFPIDVDRRSVIKTPDDPAS